MNLVNKLFLGLAAATLVSASAFAGTVTQTIGPVSSDSHVSWTRQDLGDITLAKLCSLERHGSGTSFLIVSP